MDATDLVAAFLAGVIIGAVLTMAWALRLAARYKGAGLNLTVTPEVLTQLNGALVNAWLESRGLCWMPKGPEFKVSKEKP